MSASIVILLDLKKCVERRGISHDRMINSEIRANGVWITSEGTVVLVFYRSYVWNGLQAAQVIAKRSTSYDGYRFSICYACHARDGKLLMDTVDSHYEYLVRRNGTYDTTVQIRSDNQAEKWVLTSYVGELIRYGDMIV